MENNEHESHKPDKVHSVPKRRRSKTLLLFTELATDIQERRGAVSFSSQSMQKNQNIQGINPSHGQKTYQTNLEVTTGLTEDTWGALSMNEGGGLPLGSPP